MNKLSHTIKNKPLWPAELNVREDVDELVPLIVDFLERRLRLRLNSSLQKPVGLATGRTMQPIY